MTNIGPAPDDSIILSNGSNINQEKKARMSRQNNTRNIAHACFMSVDNSNMHTATQVVYDNFTPDDVLITTYYLCSHVISATVMLMPMIVLAQPTTECFSSDVQVQL